MNVGSRIRHFRQRSRRSQRELADAAGVGVAYLSRVENDRVTPGLRSLGRLAEGLGVPVAALLNQTLLEAPDRCPVSLSGRCILDEPAAVRGRPKKDRRERYRPEDLEVLRRCNLLLQSGDKRAFQTVVTFLDVLLARRRGGR